MEGLLQHQNSTAVFQRNYKRCMWDWLRIFDLQNRLSVRKLLEDSSHGDSTDAGSVKIPKSYVPLGVNENNNLDDEPDVLLVNKGSQTKRSPGKPLVRALIFKKIFSKHHRKQKTIPVTPQLMRTISIHHSECNDYVLPTEMTSDTVSSKIDFNSQKIVNHVSHTELNHLTAKQAKLLEECCRAQDASSKQEGSVEDLGRDAAFQSNDFISRTELFNAHSDSFLEIIEDQDLVLENLQDLHRSGSARVLMKSGLFPAVKSLVQKPASVTTLMGYDIHSMSSKDCAEEETPKSEPSAVDEHSAYYSSEFSPRYYLELTRQGDHENLSIRSRNVKKKLKDVVNENRREHRHISMDGLLHKIPYGQTVSGDVIKEKLFRSASARYYGESTRDSVSIPLKAHPHQNFRRSHSLSVSSDIYSHVFESILTSESKRVPENLTSAELGLGVQDRKRSKGFGRIHYNRDSMSFPRKDVLDNSLHGVLLSKMAPRNLLNEDEATDVHTPTETKSGDTYVNMKESIEPNIILEQTLDVDTGGTIDGALELPLLRNELTENETCRVSCTSENIGCICLLKEQFLDHQESHIESEAYEVSDSSHVGDSHVAHEHGLKVDSRNESTKPSPTSILDLNFKDDLFRPAKYEFLEDSEIDPRSLHFEELDFLAKTQNALNFNVSDEIDTAESDIGKMQPEVFPNIDKSHIQADHKNEANFNYVRDVLRKYGFSDTEFIGARHCPNRLVNPLLSAELFGPPGELEIASYDSNYVFPDHQVLFDLINETILEISENFSSRCWFSRFDSHIRTMPMKSSLHEEVWTKVSSHLSSQTQPTHMYYDRVVARDFAKHDGWLNLQQDAMCLGVELENLILDDLLDELILGDV